MKFITKFISSSLVAHYKTQTNKQEGQPQNSYV